MANSSSTDLPTRNSHRHGMPLAERLMWACPLFSVLLAAAIVWLMGFDVWTSLLVGVLLGCPIAVTWALIDAHLNKSAKSGEHR